MSTFYIEQFGCRATQADGAAIERQLLDRGCTASASLQTAEFVVINTCTVTSSADAQARDAIRKIHAQNPAAKIVVTGCYAQRAPEELAALPGVSFVVGNSHKPQIPHLVSLVGAQHVAPQTPSLLIGDIFQTRDVLVAPVLGGEGNHTRPTLKIQDGCNNRCSFCVIPFVRGKSRSLPPDQVLSEIRRLCDSGFQEIVLSGINLGTWGRDLSPRGDFLDLARRILDETPLPRLRISSIEPLDVTQDVITLFAGTDRIADHFHMPLQSGSDNILAAMHRWYRTGHYARRVKLIREFLPHAAIGADVIAGFPGETEADHAATLRFIDSLPFTYLMSFPILPARARKPPRAIRNSPARQFIAAPPNSALSASPKPLPSAALSSAVPIAFLRSIVLRNSSPLPGRPRSLPTISNSAFPKLSRPTNSSTSAQLPPRTVSCMRKSSRLFNSRQHLHDKVRVMRILGLSKLSRDSAAALFDDHTILAALEEAKLTRLQEAGYVPRLAMARLIDHFHLKPSDLAAIAVADLPPSASKKNSSAVSSFHQLRHLLKGSRHILRFDHHLCHAASAYYASGFDRALVLTLDEGSMARSGSVALGDGDRIKPLRNITFPNSVGWFYSRLTQYLGLRANRDEHKLQWLSKDGQPEFLEAFRRVFSFDSKGLPVLNRRYFTSGHDRRGIFS